MTDLEQAAQRLLDVVEKGHWEYVVKPAILNLKKALAQQQAEPVAACVCGDPTILNIWHRKDGPCFASQQAEPVAWLSIDCIGERYLCFSKPLDNDPVFPLFAHPPQQAEPIDWVWDYVEPQQAEPVVQAFEDVLALGLGIMQDGKRIDPVSIYKEQADDETGNPSF
jgi:hypothetical protein